MKHAKTLLRSQTRGIGDVRSVFWILGAAVVLYWFRQSWPCKAQLNGTPDASAGGCGEAASAGGDLRRDAASVSMPGGRSRGGCAGWRRRRDGNSARAGRGRRPPHHLPRYGCDLQRPCSSYRCGCPVASSSFEHLYYISTNSMRVYPTKGATETIPANSDSVCTSGPRRRRRGGGGSIISHAMLLWSTELPFSIKDLLLLCRPNDRYGPSGSSSG